MIDLIRTGVPPAELRAHGDRAVFNALVRTASSAVQQGWDFPLWAALISEAKSVLGHQCRVKSSGKEKTRARYEKTLQEAWDKAAGWVKAAPPPFTREDALSHVATVRTWVADAEVDLTDADRAVMAAAVELAEYHGTTRPALPRARMVELSGLGERTVRNSLARLNRRGLLVQVDPGRSSAQSGRRRAALYLLPSEEAMQNAYQYRETRSVGPPAQVYGTPTNSTRRTPAQVYGTPTNDITIEEEPAVVTLTISATDPEALAAAISALRRDPAVAVRPEPGNGSNTVVPLAGRRPRRRSA
ncbi:hypothetical protein O2W18_04395 [Modestobacter sp. VKM Ac-2983]|uniref:hypothetical protein n=1 Tax=Modestobacter sp. VKM Ac-2983 TaxID=3004137 RepID=UPI0022AB9F4A|nr:hypothetical protein [Modestobacter sp. VKM Ac-2983]MCZ2804333.1 hypothetical protein [Modestobacter sp. VKM Ac-2983]